MGSQMTLARKFWILVLWVAALPAWGQGAMVEASPALDCLTRGSAPAPIYPPELFARNEVRKLESSQPWRRPFLDWLAGMTLNFDDKTNLHIAGQDMTISVPCGALDL
jgi:hypothetical protein